MPIHDWTRVNAGIFHDFHHVWIAEMRQALNRGLLPAGYYALAEQMAGGLGPDVLALQAPPTPGSNGSATEPTVSAGGPSAVAVAVCPPRVRFTFEAEAEAYTQAQRTLVIRHSSEHRIVALIEVVSPGNKASAHPFRTFLDKSLAALSRKIHLLLIDLLPPGPRDPRGVHATVWEELTGERFSPPTDKPLTLAAYSAGLVKRAYVEPVAVGDTLPDMPLFLAADNYVNVPLERTHQEAWAGVPAFYRAILESPRA